MCGIAGWYRRGGKPVSEEIVTAQCNQIVYRGPDDCGYLTDGDFGFGMRRLSIIDVEGGHQPIETSDGRYAIVFNGEIYNHLELRSELEAAGYRFRTHSDTETLLASFVIWQDEAWLRLEGMYAAAIWDHRTRTLTLARDPLGIKPLYLTSQHGGLAFASEQRALRVLPDHSFCVDEHAVNDFFSFGHVQKPRSIYREVHSLPPGHILRISSDGDPSTHQFWKPHFEVRDDLSEADWIAETREQVSTAVKKHMLADVPVASFLSGGIDSATITAIMSQVSDTPVKAFTLGFPGSRLDETASARAVADQLGCEHIVLPLQPMDAAELLPRVQSAFDEPCAATAAVPLWHISRLAAEHVKVVLCGEGGDELFAGYKRQRTAQHMEIWKPLMRSLGPAMGVLDHLPVTRFRKWNYLRQNSIRFRDAALLDSGFQRFFRGTQITSPAVRERIYSEPFRSSHLEENEYARLEAQYFDDPELRDLAPLQQFILADLTVHMPGSLLNRLDRTSMAHSLEARVPFLSHKFVDWTLTMPMDMKLRGNTGKYVLREAAKPWLGDQVLKAPKLGFQLPFAEWFSGGFSDFAREAWHGSGVMESGLLDPAAVESIFAEHRGGQADHGRALFAITMFSCWWMDQSAGIRDKPAVGG
jgi:asparagine synthase (glutamine-hydrolysing)